ncbi:MAG: DUF433 domain-containing protein [Proteobacteria bacterium]|nr:DUF433 domain-containing protein [Pseudomonadota bacterium]
MDAFVDTLVGRGLYSVGEASRLTGVPTASVHRWLRGYRIGNIPGNHYVAPVWSGDIGEIDDSFILSFMDLMELRIVKEFRAKGVSLQSIRMAIRRATELFERDHPLARRRLLTDGRSIFAEVAEENRDPKLVDLVKNQYAFERVVRPSLYASMEYGADEQVLRWYPVPRRKSVMLDPGRSFGRPIVVEGVPREILSGAVQAGESVTSVANWYDVSQSSVRAAIQFEANLAA